MRVLVENGSHHLTNLGDVALLQVALARLRAIWPGAELHVRTRDRQRLARLCPGAHPVEAGAFPLAPLRERLYLRSPALRRAAATARWIVPRGGALDPRDFDAVVACGGGFLADPFREHALRVLATLGAAARAGRPAAMLGQGLGPIDDPALAKAARDVLPRLDLILVRDGRSSLRLAHQLGVVEDRAIVTGDDAVEMARAAAPTGLGRDLGVNIRVAGYTGVGRGDLAWIGTAVGTAARALGASIVPLPVSSHPTEPDAVAIRLALGGDGPGDATTEAQDPQELIARAGRCRLVVTGSYHAGVFALAQGVPVVALAATRYYAEKFAGLEDRFRAGLRTVGIREPGAAERLGAAIREGWQTAEGTRPGLLAAADEQVGRAWAAYRQMGSLVAVGPGTRNR